MNTVELQIKQNDDFVKVELDKTANFPFNLKISDLTNPTVIRNTYSNQITIPRTDRNDHVFSHVWKLESQKSHFDPSIATDFRLYVNNDLFQAGYMKMEEITASSYKIRLYGGLGNYFAFLDTIKLADLDIDCKHPVNLSNVKNAMLNDNDKYGYALTYQGKYDKFDDEYMDTGSLLEEATWSCGAVAYSNPDLTENKRTHNDYAGEYRTYYQKPTIKFETLLNAIKDISKKEREYDIVFDPDFFGNDNNNPYYHDLWMLCNNYEVGDIPGGYPFSIKEFGDENSTDTQESEYKISKNEAKWYGKEIPCSDFISNDKWDPISTMVVISEPILLNKNDKIDINLFTRMIATSYDSDKNDSRYRFKDNIDLICGVDIYDKDGMPLKTFTTSTTSNRNSNVAARKFNAKNVGEKRPVKESNNGFGMKKNFIYDDKSIGTFDSSKQDNGTLWKYSQYYEAREDNLHVVVVFRINGYTWWKVNGNNDSRKYGVAFQIDEKSTIYVRRDGEPEPEDRENTTRTLKDIVGSDYTCADLLLSYSKLFGLYFKIDVKENKIHVLRRDNFYRNEILDWTDKVDRAKEFKIEPLGYNFRKGIFKYNELDTKYEERYRAETLQETLDKEVSYKEYGSSIVHTGYELENIDYNYLDGIIFDNCVMVTDSSPYYSFRGNSIYDNKELPHLEDTSGSKVDLKGYVLLFRDENARPGKKCRLTDDTDLMSSKGRICWNASDNNFEALDEIPKYVRTIKKEDGVYSLNFGKPGKFYCKSEEEQTPNSGIYPRYWRSYISDRLDSDCKLLTCYVYLESKDIEGDILSKFIYIDNTLWVIDEVKGFNPLSKAPTKVRLVKVKDKNNYLVHGHMTDTFKIYNKDNVLLYDNEAGKVPDAIVLDETVGEVTFTIHSSIDWTASSNFALSRTEGTGNTDTPLNITVTVPTGGDDTVRFNYGSTGVTLRIKRNVTVRVEATATNGGRVTINGLPSPKQVVLNSRATFSAEGETDFLYWEIEGKKYGNSSHTMTIEKATSAVAHFLAPGEIRLYCNDPYTSITGEEMEDGYWKLTVNETYTFNNTNTENKFAGFLFYGDTTYSGTGPRKIKETDTYLSVYYDSVLLNITAINKSPEHMFMGDTIYIAGESFEFECLPDSTEYTIMNTDVDSEITFERYDYHYPTFSRTTFEAPGVYDLVITGNRVGWDGDVEETIETPGYLSINRKLYGPVNWTILSNLAVTPTSGSSDTDMNIILNGLGGEVTQRIGGFEYQLKLIQENTVLIGWTDEKLISYQLQDIAWDTESSVVKFYHNNFPLIMDAGMVQGGNTADSDGSVWSGITVTYTKNPGTTARTLIFTIMANNTAFTLYIHQEGAPEVAGSWWGQSQDEETGKVTGRLTGADGLTPSATCLYDFGTSALRYRHGYFCGNVYATLFAGNLQGIADSANKVNSTLTFTGSSAETFNGSTDKTVHIPEQLRNPEALKFTGGSTAAYNGSTEITVNIPTKLANPYALTFTGGSTEVYDGSAAKSVAIPQKLPNPQNLIIKQGSTTLGTYNGADELTVTLPSYSLPAFKVIAMGNLKMDHHNVVTLSSLQLESGLTMTATRIDEGVVSLQHTIGHTNYYVMATPYYNSYHNPDDMANEIHNKSQVRVCVKASNSFFIRGVNVDNGGKTTFWCDFVVYSRT